MTRVLNGKELASYIKDRQSREVRSLTHGGDIVPKLAIVQVKDDPIIDTYIRLKKKYGGEIGIEVESHHPKQSDSIKLIQELNKDDSVHGIIVQLPLVDVSQTDEIVNAVAKQKDVDALAQETIFDPATPTAILWLLAGYNVDLKNKKVIIVGKGKLVGNPLYSMLKASNVNVEVVDREIESLEKVTKDADIIITATGSPAIIYSAMVKKGAVVVDAGVASENGKKVGDLAADIYERDDLTITPKFGGVGPLTVCSLFENVIKAVRAKTNN